MHPRPSQTKYALAIQCWVFLTAQASLQEGRSRHSYTKYHFEFQRAEGKEHLLLYFSALNFTSASKPICTGAHTLPEANCFALARLILLSSWQCGCSCPARVVKIWAELNLQPCQGLLGRKLVGLDPMQGLCWHFNRVSSWVRVSSPGTLWFASFVKLWQTQRQRPPLGFAS